MDREIATRNIGAGLIATALLIAAGVFIFNDVDDESAAAPRIDSVQGEYGSSRLAEAPSFSAEPAEDDPEEAPDFEVVTLGGEPFSLSAHRGEVVVLNFWATWCAPCRLEIPDLIEMQDELEGRVQFLGISVDHEGEEVVIAFVDDMKINYPIALDDGRLAEMYGGVYGLPTTIIIDKAGTIQRKIPGLVTKDVLMPILTTLADMG